MKFLACLGLLSVLVIIDAREPAFAPYIDVTMINQVDLPRLQGMGLKAMTLAFALGGIEGCTPMWGGVTSITDPEIIGAVEKFKQGGGDVIVAYGGALGPYLESVCGSSADLANAYEAALTAVGSTHIDVDIEASIPLDTLNAALASLQQKNSAITVSFTLEVQGDDYGITDALGVDVLKNAVKHGVNVDIVNPMTMDFGTSKNFGDAVISAAEATHGQMKQVWPEKSDQELYSMLGVTPMLGRNDNGQLFDQGSAQKLVQWAKEKQIGHLAFWSLGRDKPCPGSPVSPSCSSISQEEYEFTKIFAQFG